MEDAVNEPMRFLLPVVFLAGLGTALVPSVTAYSCDWQPLVTVGGNSPPSPGVYYFEGSWSACGAPPGETFGDPGQCATVPPVFILGDQVPGTGATQCAVVFVPYLDTFAAVMVCGPQVGPFWCLNAHTNAVPQVACDELYLDGLCTPA